jgi:hypothetical protein
MLVVPRRIEQVVPNALQSGGLAAGPAARDEQVAAVLKIKRGEIRIPVQAGGLQLRDAVACRQVGARCAPEREADAAEEFLIVGPRGPRAARQNPSRRARPERRRSARRDRR